MRIVLRRLAWGLLVVLAIYLVVGNIFLNTALGSWAINRKPEKFHMSWAHGVTWWPGFVALWEVRTKGHVRRVAWNARAARVHGRIALLPLFARELRVVSVDADGVAGGVDRVDEDMLPPLPRSGGWTLRFDRIATDSLTHARIAGFDIEAAGSAEFGFVKQLRGGPMQILPSQLALRGARIKTGTHEVLREGSIDAGFSIARHRREDASGMAALGLADATLKIGGLLPALAIDLDPSGHWRGALAASGATGRLDANLVLQHGVLKSGGVLDARVPLRATRGVASINDEASLRAEVESDGIRLKLHLPPPPEGKGTIDADLRIAGKHVPSPADLHVLMARTSGTVDLDWHFESLDWLGPLLVTTPWLALEGAGRIDANLKIHEGRLEPGSRIDVPDVELAATIADHRFKGRARATGRLDAGTDAPQAHVDLVLARFDVVADNEPDKPLVRGTDLHIELDSTGDLHRFHESLQARLRFEKAEVPDLRAINAYLPTDSLSLIGGSTLLGGDLALDASGHIKRGRLDISARRAQAQFGEIRFSGDFDLDARIGGSDIAARYFDLDNTTLHLRNVSIVDAGRTAGEQWWANLSLKRGRIEATKPFNIDASADVEMQNVGLLLALFTRHRDYPGWALKLADAGTLRASGQLRMHGSSVVFDRVEANNDRFGIKARLRIAKARPNGDLLLRWRAFGLGLELDQDKRKFHFLRAAEWYDARPHLLDVR